MPNPRHWLRVAPDVARSLDEVVDRHGEAISRVAPRAWRDTLRAAAKFNFLRGSRRRGMSLLRRLWIQQPLTPLSWVIWFFGMLGPV